MDKVKIMDRRMARWTDGQTDRRRQQQYPFSLKSQGVETNDITIL